MFYIRADANPKLGSGHVMRCLAIAKALRKIGEEVLFLTADHQSEKLIKKHGFSYHCLNSSYEYLEQELPAFTEQLSMQKVQAVIVDSYFITKRYLEELRAQVKVIYLDDLNQFIYPVDVLINYNIYAKELPYALEYPKETKLWLGCEYIPLRDEFIGKSRSNTERVTNLLITTGGADAYNMAGQLITFLREREEYNLLVLHVVAGPLNQNIDMLIELTSKYNGVYLHQNVTNMAELMINCEIAVSAGGSTLYELCACGVPTISFAYADNQLQGVKEFDRQGLIPYAGDLREDSTSCLQRITEQITLLCQNQEIRKLHSTEMKKLVDGFGSQRIAELLLTI